MNEAPGATRIALLGAPGTGKSRLASELAQCLQGHVTIVDGDAATACDATLVLGLDLPSARGGEAADMALRARLQSAGVNFQVVYGTGGERLQSALRALDAAGVLPAGMVRRDAQEEGCAARAWSWVCEKCSDPACEHRLFTRLRQER